MVVGEDGLHAFKGALVFATVGDLWQAMKDLFEKAGVAEDSTSRSLIFDLAEVVITDSGALALLLEGVDLAHKNGCKLRYLNLPDDLVSLARISNAADLLPG